VVPILIAAFSLFFAYVLSFPFEGQVLYSLLNVYRMEASHYILAPIVAHFLGLLSCGFFVKTAKAAKHTMIIGMGLCAAATLPFFFEPSALWMGSLILGGYASGCGVAAWGHFLKAYTSKNERLKTCASVLIYSNMIMIIINITAIHWSAHMGLAFVALSVLICMTLMLVLPHENKAAAAVLTKTEKRVPGEVWKPTLVLCIFIVIITINSGLMYQVINPSFEHLTGLTSWYWAVPYIAALILMRNLPHAARRSKALYLGMAMIMGAFIGFMILGRNTLDYIIIDTLMLGACGIFDLFWWSILGEMLDYTNHPVKMFGIGLSANVLGVLLGDALGVTMMSAQIPNAQVTVIALVVVCVTVMIMPLLNRQLIKVLKGHTYLVAYDSMNTTERAAILHKTEALDPLTAREQEILEWLLLGMSNREIATSLFISESTVKTHVRNIFSKYAVASRAELISTLLRDQSEA
jgi:DNA-binding CsgD family transcriptional regulator